EWSNVLTKTLPGDWTGFAHLSFDVFLEGDMPADFGFWIRDKALHKAEAAFTLGPGANTLTIPLNELNRTGGLEISTITGMCFYKLCPEEITVHLDNVRISEKPPKIPEAPPVRMADTDLVGNGGFEETQAPDKVGSAFKNWSGQRKAGAGYLGTGTVA